MKKNLLILFTFLLLGFGCSKWTYNPDKYDLTKHEAFIAYVFNGYAKLEPTPDPTPDPINPTDTTKCGKCDKNCKVLSGDGILKVPCICGKNCKCHEPEPKVSDDCSKSVVMKPARQVYYFGHDQTCGFCVMTKRDVFPPLREMNPPWKIGEEDTDFIKVIDWTPELAEKYDVSILPVYILFVDGEEVARHVGYINHIKLSKFYYSGEVK